MNLLFLFAASFIFFLLPTKILGQVLSANIQLEVSNSGGTPLGTSPLVPSNTVTYSYSGALTCSGTPGACMATPGSVTGTLQAGMIITPGSFVLGGTPLTCTLPTMNSFSCASVPVSGTSALSFGFSVPSFFRSSQGVATSIANFTYMVSTITDLQESTHIIQTRTTIVVANPMFDSTFAVAGSPLSLTAQVTNNGPSDAENVAVSLDSLGTTNFASVSSTTHTCMMTSMTTLSCAIGTLTSTQSVPLQITINIPSNQATTPSAILNFAVMTDEDMTTPSLTQPSSFPINHENDLSPAISAPATATAGTQFSKTVTLTNNGPSIADIASVVVNFGTGVSITSPMGCTPSGVQEWTCTTSNLISTGSVPFMFDVDIDADNRMDTSCSATSQVEADIRVSDPNGLNNNDMVTVTTLFSSDLSVDMIIEAMPSVIAGQGLPYSIAISNAGPTTVPMNGAVFDFVVTPAGAATLIPDCGPTLPCTLVGPLPPMFMDTITVQVNVLSNFTGSSIDVTATLTGTDMDPTTPNTAMENTLVTQEVDLAITNTVAPLTAPAGTEYSYITTVTNNGPSDSVGFTFSQEIPAPLTATDFPMGCTPMTMPSRIECTASLVQSTSVDFNITVSIPSDTLAMTLASNVMVMPNNEISLVSANDMASYSTNTTIEHDLSATLTSSPDPVIAGQTLTYTLNITNNGPSDALSIAFDLMLDTETTLMTPPAMISCDNVGQLVNCSGLNLVQGATTSLDFVTSISSLRIADLTAAITTLIAADPLAVDPLADNTPMVTTTVNTQADLQLSMLTSTDPVTAGTPATINVAVTNAGPSNGRMIVVQFTFDPMLASVASGNPANMGCTVGMFAGQYDCTVPDQDTGMMTTRAIVLDVAPSARGSLSVMAEVSSVVFDDVDANNNLTVSASIITEVDLSLVTAVTPMTFAIAGRDSIMYSYTITNAGPSDANVTLTSNLDTGLTLTAVSDMACSNATNVVTCTPFVIVPMGTLLLSVTAAVNSDTVNMTTTTAMVTAIETESMLLNNNVTDITVIETRVNLDVVLETPTTTVAGETFSYNVTVNNAGPSVATGVIVTLPFGVVPGNEFMLSTTELACVDMTDHLECTFASIADGASVSFAVTAMLASSAINTIDVIASVTGNDMEESIANNMATATIGVVVNVDVAVSGFMLSSTPATAGLPLTYSITVTSTGSSDARDVTLSFPLDLMQVSEPTMSSPGCSFFMMNSTVACNTPYLATGGMIQFDVTVLVLSNNRNPTYSFNATAEASIGNEVAPSDNTLEISTAIQIQADVAAQATSFSPTIYAGAIFGFSVYLVNNGPSDATDVSVTFSHVGANFSSVSSSLVNCSSTMPDMVTCDLMAASLVVDDDLYFSIFFQTDSAFAGTMFSLMTEALSPDDTMMSTPTTTSVTVDLLSKVEIVAITDFPDPVLAGNDLNWEIDLLNSGPSDDIAMLTSSLASGLGAPTLSASGLTCTVAGCTGTLPVGTTIRANVTSLSQSNVALNSMLTNQFQVASTSNAACSVVVSDAVNWLPINEGNTPGSSEAFVLSGSDFAVLDLPLIVSTNQAVSKVVPLFSSPSTTGATLTFGLDFTLGPLQVSGMHTTIATALDLDSTYTARDGRFIVVTSTTLTFYNVTLDAPGSITLDFFNRIGSNPMSVNFLITLTDSAGVTTPITASSAQVTFPGLAAGTYSISFNAMNSIRVVFSTGATSTTCPLVALALEASTDFGATWSALSTDLPYTDTVANEWCGTLHISTAAVTMVSADLSPFLDTNLQLRFVLSTRVAGLVTGVLTADIDIINPTIQYSCSGLPGLAGVLADTTTTVDTLVDMAVVSFTGSPEPVVAGTPLTYTLVFENNGPSLARGVAVAIDHNATLSNPVIVGGAGNPMCNVTSSPLLCTFNDLAPTDEVPGAQYSVVVQFDLACPTLGDVISSATVLSTVAEFNATDNFVETTNNATRQTAFFISFSGDPLVFSDNGTVNYTVGVTNTGPSSGTNVMLSFNLEGVAAMSASLSGAFSPMCSQPTASTFDCLIAEFPCGASESYTLAVMLPLATTGSITHNVTLSGELGTEDATDNTASFTQDVNQVDLQIAPILSGQDINNLGGFGVPGQNITFAFSINYVPVPMVPARDATDVFFSLGFPADLTFVMSNETCAVNVMTGDLECMLPNIVSGTTFNFSAIFEIAPSVLQGTLLNVDAAVTSAEVDFDTNDNMRTGSAVANTIADLSVNMSTPLEIQLIGDFVHYFITFRNDGPSNANNVNITHSHPPGTLLPSFFTGPTPPTLGLIDPAMLPGISPLSLPPGFSVTQTPGTTTITITNLPVGTEMTIVSRVITSSALRFDGTDNFEGNSSVTISSSEADTDLSANADEVATFFRVFSDTDLTISPTFSSLIRPTPPTAAAGALVTYQALIINQGPSDATVVDLTFDYNISEITFAGNAQLQLGPMVLTLVCSPSPDLDENGRNQVQCFLSEIPLDPQETSDTRFFSGLFRATVDWQLNPSFSGVLQLGASLQFNEFDGRLDDNILTTDLHVGASDLAVSLTAAPSPTIAGTTVTLVGTVTNSAGSNIATGVVYTQTIPVDRGSVDSITIAPLGSCNLDAMGLLSCDLPDQIAGASTTITTVLTLFDDATGMATSTATVFSDQFDITTADRTASTSIVINDCDLVTTLTAAPTADAGANITYSAVVMTKATSNNTCTGVIYTQTVAPGTVVLSSDMFCATNNMTGDVECMLGNIPANVFVPITITVGVASGVLEGEILRAIGVAAPQEFDLLPADNIASAFVTTTVLSDLQLTLSAPSTLIPGQQSPPVTYTVANNGPSDSVDTSLLINVPPFFSIDSLVASIGGCSIEIGNITCTFDAIVAGDSGTIEIIYNIDPDITGTANFDGVLTDAVVADPDLSNNMVNNLTTFVATTDLTFAVFAPASRLAGQFATLTAQLDNLGPGTAINTNISLLLDAAFASPIDIFVSVNAMCTASAGAVDCMVPALPPDASVFIAVTSLIDSATPAATMLSFSGAVSNAADVIPGNDMNATTITVGVQSALTVSLLEAVPANAGEVGSLVLLVENLGPSDSAANLSPTLAATPTGSAMITALFSLDNALYTPCGSTACALPALGPDDSAIVRFDILFDNDWAFVQGVNVLDYNITVSDAADPNSPHVIGPAMLSVTAVADLDLSKTAPVLNVAGTELNYTLVVTNNGPSLSPSATIVDTLGDHVTVTSAPGCVVAMPLVTCSVGPLAPAAMATFTITVDTDSDTRDLTLNQAVVTGDVSTTDPNPDNNAAFAPTDLTGVPVLAATFTSLVDPVAAGAPLSYNLTLENTGASDALDVSAFVTVPAGQSLGAVLSSGLPAACSTFDGAQPATSLCAIPSIPAGSSITLTFESPVPAGEQGPMLITGVLIQQAEIVDILLSADTTVQPRTLGLTLSDMPDPVAAGSEFELTATVSNAVVTPATDASNAVLTFALPSADTALARYQIDSGRGSCGASAIGGMVRCDLPVVLAGSTEVVRLFLAVGRNELDSTLTTTISLNGEGLLAPVMASETTTVVGTSLAVSVVEVSADPNAPGQTIQLDLTLDNSATLPTADLADVRIAFDLPSTNVRLAQVISAVDASCGQVTDNMGATPDSIVCHVPSVAPLAAETLSLFFDLGLAEVGPTLAFAFNVSATGLFTTLMVSETTTVDPINSLALTVSGAMTPLTAVAGEEVIFSVAISNTPLPNTDATNVELSFVLPQPFTSFVSSDSSSTTAACGLLDSMSATVQCIVPVIVQGATETIDVRLAIAPNQPMATLDIDFMVTATELGLSVNQIGQVDVTESVLTVTATDMVDPVGAGNEIQYELLLTNPGPVAINDVQISFTLPSIDAFFVDSSSTLPGLVCGRTTNFAGIMPDDVMCLLPSLPATTADAAVNINVLLSQAQSPAVLSTTFNIDTAIGLITPVLVTETTTTTPGSIDLAVNVTFSGMANSLPFAAQTLTYTAVVSGDVSAAIPTRPALRVDFDAALTFVSATTTPAGLLSVGSVIENSVLSDILTDFTTNGTFSVELVFDKDAATLGSFDVRVAVLDQADSGNAPIPDLNPANDQDVATASIAPTTLAVTATVAPESAEINTDVVFTVNVANNGVAPATNARLLNYLPSGVALAAVPAGCTQSGDLLDCALGNLAADTTVQFTIQSAFPANLTTFSTAFADGFFVADAGASAVARSNIVDSSAAVLASSSFLLLAALFFTSF